MPQGPRNRHHAIRRWWLGRGVQTKVMLIVAVPSLMLLATAGAFQVSKVQADRSSGWVAHTQTVQVELNYLLTLVVDVETGVRGYLLTGEPGFLEPYDRAVAVLPGALDRLRRLVSDNPAQTARARTLTATVAEDLDVLRRLRALDPSAHDPGQVRLLSTDGKQATDRLRGDVGQMLTAENRLLTIRQAATRRWYARATWLVTAGGVLGIGGGLASGRLLTISITRRLRESALNAGRMAQRRPLSVPAQVHHDEVAALDDALARAAGQLQVNVDQLEEQRCRSAAILESMHDGVAIFDLDLRIVDVNPRYCQMLGRERHEIIGAAPPFPWWTSSSADQVQLLHRLRDLIAEGVPLTYEQTISHPDGTRRVKSATAAPLRDVNGRVTEVVSTFTDITDRAAAEEMQRRIEQLQRLDGLGQLAGGVAHDFNNLLVIIGGHARIMFGKLPEDSPLRLSAQRIIEAAAKGDALTRQMLAFARGKANSGSQADLGLVLGEIQPLLAAAAGEAVVLRISGGQACSGLWVPIGHSQLEQALINLAANARDAMPDGGTLTIEGRRTDSSDPMINGSGVTEWVKLTVGDTGHGMDEATQARIFDPFFTTKSLAEGTGLGLSTVHGIVTKAGGLIRVGSRPGHGTTFEICLPITARAATTDATEPARSGDSAGAPHALPAHLRVLLVEDQPAVAELVTTVLQDVAAEVHTFNRAAAALAALDGGLRVDVLLTDVIMPEMTGPELVAAMHARDLSLPVLYMSGYASGALDQVELGREAHLVAKPFTADQVLLGLGYALASAPAGSAGHRTTVPATAGGPPDRRVTP